MSADQPQNLSARTGDIAAELRTKVQQLLPGVLMDGVLDVDRLAELLNVRTSGNPTDKERFGLMWAGRRDAVTALQEPSMAALVPDMENSINWDTAENVFIEGDNLEVLKLMQKAYNDSVKLIYIDPPYNTGNDFVYNDDFSDSARRYLEVTGQIDETGNRLSSNTDVSGRRHSRWLSMMFPRLVLARNLLRQDGLILISIDENELHHLTCLVDEIFGEENRIGHFYWKKRGTGGQVAQNALVKQVEIVVAVARNLGELKLHQLPNDEAGKEKWRDFRKSGGQWQRQFRPKQFFPIYVNPADLSVSLEKKSGWIEVFPRDSSGEDGFWENGVPTTTSRIAAGELRGKLSRGVMKIEQQTFAGDASAVGTFIDIPSSRGGDDLKSLMGSNVFDNPKPTDFMDRLIRITTSGDDLILDFFAGSGSTGHGVAIANSRDKQNRKYVLVNAPERVSEKSAAAAAGFRTIPEITRSRLKMVTSTVPGADAMGLRCLTLGPSSFVDTRPGEQSGLPLLVENTLRENASDDAIAAEVLLKSGVRLEEAWNRKAYAGEDVVESGSVAVVLARKASDDVVAAALGNQDAHTTLFLEDSFAEVDGVKTNAYFGFKQANKTMKTV